MATFNRGHAADKFVFDYFLHNLDAGNGSAGKALCHTNVGCRIWITRTRVKSGTQGTSVI